MIDYSNYKIGQKVIDIIKDMRYKITGLDYTEFNPPTELNIDLMEVAIKSYESKLGYQYDILC